ncbi:sn-glycerol-3-phosphate ABC transporter substrate-binding protein UgpB [Roseomonas sp. AR75]|uniref:sn-glycerol-3-phosphate ABC transporter substrate-binding protein UgpB n=1 Tax=Roseomonas sp. AR75 TaxID=2562311 RepID=UPI0010BF7DD5|nr:sn-glycerol-3-phosphate ABC transporter substrate-binding protein UgpB [Roseomonas sp. AR75]
MHRRTLMASAAALGLAGSFRPALAQQRTEIQFWHGLSQPLGGMLEAVVKEFNDSQTRYTIVPSYRGSYPETMVAAIAAFRAGQAPAVVQMFEVGTGTMMNAGRAIIPTYQLLANTGVTINWDDFLPGVRGYYAAADGKQMSMPFNSSTAITYYNKDAFRAAGLNPDQFPETWGGIEEAMRKLKAAGPMAPLSVAWPTWTQMEQFSAIHDIPLATLGNGFGGLNTELSINNELMLRHLTNLTNWQKDGLFKYGGRNNAGEPAFPAGECAIMQTSSGFRARVQREARFGWGVAMLPFYEGRRPANSIIGGASFWVMNNGPNAPRSEAEQKGIADFFAFLAKPDVAGKWHMDTGYLPITKTGFEYAKSTGFYRKPENVGAEVPIEQMLRGATTENTRGIRLGGFVQIRDIWQEEMEKSFQGQQTPQQALVAMTTRGNQVLRNFERANRG